MCKNEHDANRHLVDSQIRYYKNYTKRRNQWLSGAAIVTYLAVAAMGVMLAWRG